MTENILLAIIEGISTIIDVFSEWWKEVIKMTERVLLAMVGLGVKMICMAIRNSRK